MDGACGRGAELLRTAPTFSCSVQVRISPVRCATPCLPGAAAGQGTISPDDVAQAVLFCFRLSKNAVPEEVGGN